MVLLVLHLLVWEELHLARMTTCQKQRRDTAMRVIYSRPDCYRGENKFVVVSISGHCERSVMIMEALLKQVSWYIFAGRNLEVWSSRSSRIESSCVQLVSHEQKAWTGMHACMAGSRGCLKSWKRHKRRSGSRCRSVVLIPINYGLGSDCLYLNI